MVLGLRDTDENPEIIEMMGDEGPHITKSKSYKFALKQNDTMELLNISSP